MVPSSWLACRCHLTAEAPGCQVGLCSVDTNKGSMKALRERKGRRPSPHPPPHHYHHQESVLKIPFHSVLRNYVCDYVSVRTHAYMVKVSQSRASAPLALELEMAMRCLCRCQESDSGPLQEQCELFSPEPSLQPSVLDTPPPHHHHHHPAPWDISTLTNSPIERQVCGLHQEHEDISKDRCGTPRTPARLKGPASSLGSPAAATWLPWPHSLCLSGATVSACTRMHTSDAL